MGNRYQHQSSIFIRALGLDNDRVTILKKIREALLIRRVDLSKMTDLVATAISRIKTEIFVVH